MADMNAPIKANLMNHRELLPIGFEQFIQDLFREDDLGAVVRVHIQIEYQLNEFIRKALKYPKRIEKSHFDFSQSVDLALALGLREDLGSPLKAMGTLRNRFAHKLETRLDQSSVTNLYETLSPPDKETVQQLFQMVRKTDERLNQFAKLTDLPERNQFALIATLIWSRFFLESSFKSA